MSDFKTDEQIIKHISLINMVDPRVAKLIARFPEKFLKNKMEDDNDWRPVRLRYFGIFGLTKKGRNKHGKTV